MKVYTILVSKLLWLDYYLFIPPIRCLACVSPNLAYTLISYLAVSTIAYLRVNSEKKLLELNAPLLCALRGNWTPGGLRYRVANRFINIEVPISSGQPLKFTSWDIGISCEYTCHDEASCNLCRQWPCAHLGHGCRFIYAASSKVSN